ncbi:MAG: hypothetical protein KDN19_08100 [Verrucomicrobiae bacterium]|nr:hypothetical protein [Verrucomicrobiae bacterium]
METRRFVLIGSALVITAGWIGPQSSLNGQTLATGSGVGMSTSARSSSNGAASLRSEMARPLTASQGLSGVSTLAGSLGDPAAAPELPKVFAPTRPRTRYTRYPWKRNVEATVFWIGEKPTANNPTPNNKSAWDRAWENSFGGFDNPDQDERIDFRPKDFVPGQNPFYIALPYNDLKSGGGTKTSARHVIPWFDREFERSGKTIIKGRWIAIRRGGDVCYAQWEDVGPFETDDWQYVFGEAVPKTKGNGGAGLDVSPAVRDYLGMSTRGVCDWRFVDEDEVPDGPWKKWGENNPFAKAGGGGLPTANPESIVKIREMANRYLGDLPTGATEKEGSAIAE